nr:histone deacetylase 14 [Tanacetum cinerariifolium]
MADVNVIAHVDQAPTMAPPVRTDDQIMPHIRWVPIGKSNCYLDVEKSQSNPIYKIATTGCYKCQLDEQWFDLTKDTLRDALQITPVNNNKAFSSHSSSDALINFVNELGYPKLVMNLSNVGVVNRAHLDYAERIWEEFTQSIHTFIEDKKNLAQHTHGKKKATLIVILCTQYTKLIIYHLQRKHKFYLRPDSPLHLPNEEPVLGYFKISAKGTKKEVFRMPIPGNLITTDIQGSDPDSPALKPTRTTKKSKPSAPKADLRPPPSPARKSRPGLVSKRRKPISSLRSVDEFVAEGIPEKEPRVDDEEADVQRALKESIKRRTSTPTGSSGHDKSSSLYAELGLTDSEVKSDEDVPRIDAGVQGEGQAGPNPDDQDEGQARPNPDEQDEGQAGPNPDFEVTYVSTQPHSKKIDEGFTATAYPKVQENLKLTVEEQVIIEEPASSIGTLSSLQHLTKYLSFGDLFFNDKPSKADNEKTTSETEAESMVSVTIQQDTSSIPPITTLVSKAIDAIVTDAVDWAIQAPLWNYFSDLPEADMKEILHQRMWETNSYKTHEDHKMIYEALEKSMNRDHSKKLLKDLAEARKKKKKRHDSPKTPPGSPPHQPPPPPPPTGLSGASGSPGASGSSQVPPPPPLHPSTNQEGQSHGSTAPSSSKIAASAEYNAWTTTDTRLRLSVSSTPDDLQMDDDMAPDVQAQSSDDEDIENAHIPKVNLRQDWWKPLEEDRPATPEPAWSIPSSDVPVPKNNWASALASTYSPPLEDSLLAYTGDIAMFMDWFCKRQGIIELKPQDLEGLAFELVKVFRPNVIRLYKPLPLGGPPGQVIIQSNFFFNKYLEYLRYGSKGSRLALSISKMKAAYYPDVGLEQMVPDQIWIEDECKYDIAAMYGISHWWFQRKQFYIDRHTSKGDRRAVRTHMRILSVVRIEGFSMYGYGYMKKIVLRRADPNEHIIAKRDFKYLYPSGFEDLYLLNLQGHLNHLPPKDKKILTTAVNLWTRHLVIRQRVEDFQLGIKIYQTQLNLTKPRWDATSFEYKHDYKIDEALDYRVKEFKVAVCSSLRSLKPKRTIEYKAKRSSKTISIGHYSIMLASSYTVKTGFNSLVHSFRALSTLRRSGLRTASAAAKPYQGNSSEFYLITGIPTVAAVGQIDVNSQPHAHTSIPLSMT